MRFKHSLKLALAISFLLVGFCVLGQDSIVVEKINEAIVLDGILNDNAWKSATPFNLVMHSPDFGNTPTESTTVLMCYDKEFLWVSAQLNYEDINSIVSTSKKRDEESKNPDAFGIILDTYNDKENALAFFTMLPGQRIDYAIQNDAIEGSPLFGTKNINYSWNTFWDVRTSKNENGWAVEMRIPFSSLRFQERNGKVRMGVMFNRTISHCNESDTYPSIDPKHGIYAPYKPSLAFPIELSDIKESKPVYISPYVIGGSELANELNDLETGYDKHQDITRNVGLDVKYSLTSNLTMDLTINTDFAQVEADDEKVNLSRNSLFYPEKRMFFQERASIFNFNLGGADQLFYSRRIGLANGEPTPILGGIRLIGRVGKWDLGLMDMQTGKKNESLSENFGVFRVRRQVINQNSYIGGIVTSRMSDFGKQNYSYGADGIFRLFGDDYLQVNVAQTTDTSGNNFTMDAKNSFYRFEWKRRSIQGISYEISHSQSGDEFDPQIGFMSRLGLKNTRIRGQYGWIPDENSRFFNYEFHISGSRSSTFVNNDLETAYIGPGVSFLTKKGWGARIGVYFNQQGVNNQYILTNDVFVPVGSYDYFNTRMSFFTPASKPVSSMFSVVAGGFYDGDNYSFTAEPELNLSSSVQLSGYYNVNYVSFHSRDQHFYSHVGRLKLMYMYNTKLSASSYVQLNTLNSISMINFRLRFNPKEGNDLYIVYNEVMPLDNYFPEEVSPVKYINRMIQVKYIYTFCF